MLKVAGGILTAKDVGHLITGKDINGNPLSDADRQAITSSFILDATMVGVNSLNKLKLKYANKVIKIDGIEGVSKAENIITDGSHIQNGKLKPNSIYKTGEHDYIYKTNQDGFIINAKTDKLELKNHEGRLKHDANALGKQADDHAGHLFGDRFGGSSELDNIVSQAKKVNLSEYKVIENQWAKALEKGQKVTVDININYLLGVERPISFDVFYTIDGIPFFQTITQ